MVTPKIRAGGHVRKESSRVIGVTSGPSEAQMLSESPRVHEGGRLGRRLLLQSEQLRLRRLHTMSFCRRSEMMTVFTMSESMHDRHLSVCSKMWSHHFFCSQTCCLGQAFSVSHVLASTFFQFLSTASFPCSLLMNQTNDLQLILACAIPVFLLLLVALTIRQASRPSPKESSEPPERGPLLW